MITLGRLFFTLIFGAATTSPTPSPDRRQRTASLAGYATLRDTTLASSAVRSWLETESAPGTPPLQGGGGGALITTGRLVMESSGSGSGSVRQTESGTSSLGVGQGAFDLGVILFQKRWLRVYPLVGVGGMGGGVAARGDGERAGSTGWGSLLWRGGVGIDLMLRLWRVGVMAGLRLGYQSAALHVQQGDGPDMAAPGGWFFRVVAGPFIVR